jgi:Domain of unknown function (DUF397)
MRVFAVREARGSGGSPADAWRKSSYSGYTNECIEVAGGGGIWVRDSKNPGGTKLSFAQEQWDAFLSEVRT